MEPTKHQYDFDVAAVHAFLLRFGLEREVRVNVEVNHATLAGHSFEHEIAYAIANNLLGSVDVNRGDPQLGWDTDQFPNHAADLVIALYTILRAGGLGTGGFNFDAKLRRQSVDPADLFHAHIGGIDTLARALLAAAACSRTADSPPSSRNATRAGRAPSAARSSKASGASRSSRTSRCANASHQRRAPAARNGSRTW